MRQRALLELGGALLHDGVRAVLPLDGQQRLDPVGEQGVVAPHGNVEGLLVQRLTGGGLAQPADPAHDQPGGHRLPVLVNAVNVVSVTSALLATSTPSSSSTASQ